MSELPLVSCIMPTRNRTRFLARAIDCFLAQDYPNKRIYIVEEESDSFAVLPSAKSVIYSRSESTIYASIGEKRNVMCKRLAESRQGYGYGGDLIAHWDDDDWHAPNRLSTQIAKMRAEGSRLCGLDRLVFYNNERAWLFKTVRKPWLAGGTLIYECSLWQEQPFTEVSNGEDVAFVDAAHKRGAKVSVIEDPSLYVAMLHDSNTTQRNIDAQWGGFDVATVREWMKTSVETDHART